MVASIEYIEEIIATYKRATKANQETPTRDGNVIVLSAEVGDDVMITADLHGNRRNFNAIKRIADLENQPRRHLIMQEVCHGGPTYANNGDMSHGMLEDVAKLKAAYPERVHFIMSNHELAELTDYPILKAKRMLNLMFRLGLQEMYGPATEKVREAYIDFLRSCPLGVRLPGGIFVCHSLPEQSELRGFDATVLKRPLEGIDLKENGDVFRMMWGRDYRPENAKAFAKKVNATVLIHGHEPCPNGFAVPNDTQIILDCCGETATYLMVPLDRTFAHDELVGRIKRLV
jgi:hypothetical protein